MEEKVRQVMQEVGCGKSVAMELLTLGCEDVDFVIDCCKRSESLNMAKARIIGEQLCLSK